MTKCCTAPLAVTSRVQFSTGTGNQEHLQMSVLLQSAGRIWSSIRNSSCDPLPFTFSILSKNNDFGIGFGSQFVLNQNMHKKITSQIILILIFITIRWFCSDTCPQNIFHWHYRWLASHRQHRWTLFQGLFCDPFHFELITFTYFLIVEFRRLMFGHNEIMIRNWVIRIWLTPW
jgi:hypothetical protein